jgi:excisionase family DNA binding protein
VVECVVVTTIEPSPHDRNDENDTNGTERTLWDDHEPSSAATVSSSPSRHSERTTLMPDSPSAPSITRATAIAPPGPLLVTVRQACQMLGLGRTSAYHLVRTGRLRQVRIGGAVRFSVDHLREFVEAQAAECL